MEPYWRSSCGGFVLYHGDCLDVLPTLGGIDCVLTDPPFGARRPSAWRSAGERFQEIVGNESVDARWAPLALEAANDGACLYSFCTWDTLGEWRTKITDSGWRVRSCLVWDKGIHGLADLQTCWAPRHEMILFAAKGRHELSGKRPVDLVKVQRVSPDELEHPYQKPVDLLCELLRTNSGTVLDCYMGSGSTAIACAKLGRRFIGIEISEAYCEIAARRMEEALGTGSLFPPEKQPTLFGDPA